MSTLETIQGKRREILALARSHGASNVRVFGSVVRGTDDEESDVDLLVDLAQGRSLLDLGELLTDLESLLELDVDVVTAKGLRGRIRDRILAEAQPL